MMVMSLGSNGAICVVASWEAMIKKKEWNDEVPSWE